MFLRALMILRAPDDGANGAGGGGTAPPPAAPDAAALAAKMAAQEARLAQFEQLAAQQAQQLEAHAQAQAAAQRTQQQEIVDPDETPTERRIRETEARLQASEARLQRAVAGINDRADRLEFETIKAELNLNDEDEKQIDRIMIAWSKKGIQANRQDAARYAMGMKAEEEAKKKSIATRTQREALFNDQQAALGVERPGATKRGANAPDLSKMTRKERLEKGYSHLDEQGF